MHFIDSMDLILIGFIRHIETSLNQENHGKIIPTVIIELCTQYYTEQTQIFVTTNLHHVNWPYTGNMYIQSYSFDHRFSEEHKSSYQRNLHHNKTLDLPESQCVNPFCYVENISSKMPIFKNECIKSITNNVCYYAIIGIKATKSLSELHGTYSWNRHVSLQIFESNQNDSAEQNCIEILSKNALPTYTERNPPHFLQNISNPHQLLYCDKYGVIYENDGDLYRLNLDMVNSDDFNFSKIKENAFWKHWRYKDNKMILKKDENGYCSEIKYRYLSMRYLQNEDKIFAVQCKYDKRKPTNKCLSISAKLKTTECGIFDLKRSKWSSIKNLEYRGFEKKRKFMCGISNNECGSSGGVYVVSNTGYTTKYDMNKNKWFELHDNMHDDTAMRFENVPTVWLDNCNRNILYCANDKFVGYLDVRADSSWIKLENIEIFSKHGENKWIKYFWFS